MTRCKFVCVSKREFQEWQTRGPAYDYQFSAVTGNSEENKMFWKYTPNGQLNVSTVQDGQFAVGSSYYIDISEAVDADTK